MNEESRWREDPELDAELRALLDAGAAELPYPEQLERLEARLMPLLGPGGGGGGAGGGGAGTAAGAAAKGLTIIGALVITGGLAVWGATRGQPSPARAPSLAPSSAQSEPISTADAVPAGVDPPPDAVSETRPAPTSDRDRGSERASGSGTPREPVAIGPDPSAAPDRQGASAPDPTPDPAAELTLIDAAEAARASSPARALALAEEHARRFPDGTFAQEREVVAIDALLRLGRDDDAHARAARFGARWPASAHRRRLEVLLGAP